MKNIPLLSRAPRFSHMLLAVLASVVFGGCSPYQKAAPQPEPTVPLTGMVTYRERMALPPDAELTVTLHRKTSDGRMLVAEERASTEGRNVPLPFSIACPAADSSSMSYELEAANAPMRAHGKSDSKEYFAEFFSAWLSGGETLRQLKEAAPQTYAYFEMLSGNGWLAE